MNADEFNKRNAPYSDVKDTAALLNKRAESAAAGLKFDPSSKAGRIAGGYNADFINTHVGPGIEPMDGDCSILQAYFDHAFPDLDDQKKVVRWAATLVCHPEIKMHYSLLLIGKQGVGKSTLADILTPLIGEWNCSRPNIKMVSEGNFNEWCAHKRVAVIAEVHEGHGGKGYDRLKDVITDATIDVHKKYQDTYSIDNWMHIIACSNSMRALKLDGEDRRWLVPRVTEQTRDPGEWTALRDWLNKQNGYAKTLWWFRRWLEENGGPVQRSDHAPMTTMKQDVLKENYTKGEDLTLETIERMLEANSEKSILWFDTDMRAHISRTHHGGRMDHVESADKIRKVALSAGQHVIKHRIQYRRGHRWYRAARTMALTNDPALVGLKRDELLRRVQASEVVFVNVNEEF